ncbi:serine/threonine-protein kinase, partial [Streptomyces sp. NPDC021098]|uniref:serine/threonine-protein kinase n=1 Tax=unclassified Streptomyces TaxID=2593676 RepID=UPI0037AA5D46
MAGRFRITHLVGRGAMGEVWAALDERMQRNVAVKLVHTRPDMNEVETRLRFQREVLLSGRLSHRNIVTVHDWGEETVSGREALYLVMELVSGDCLRARLNESIPPWTLAAGWAGQIAQALHVAHRAGVVHRDIKPSNVLLTPEGTLKVLDFGVAKFLGDTLRVHELTATGTPLGSPPYMSPEQALGDREVDHRSDLYSLGCLLYHAVTGGQPFTGSNTWAVLRMHIEETPLPPSALAQDLPEALNDLILRLLAKAPDDRPADAEAVYDALGGILLDHAAALPADGCLDLTHFGYTDTLAGRMLDRARQILRQAAEAATAANEKAKSSASLQEVEALDNSVRIVAEAESKARSLWSEAMREAEQKRAEADALFEETRA